MHLDTKQLVGQVRSQRFHSREERRLGARQIRRLVGTRQLEILREQVEERRPALLCILLHEASPAFRLLREERESGAEGADELVRTHLLRSIRALQLAYELAHRKKHRVALAARADVLLERRGHFWDGAQALQRRVEVARVAEVRETAGIVGPGCVLLGLWQVLRKDGRLLGWLRQLLSRAHEHEDLALLDAKPLPVCVILDRAPFQTHDLLALRWHCR
mmetsp:Transcript_54250/g.124958  ORF Transcript_54250/g.124958 Transcript_54250/m.124958 type:complete len:219 (+) Transcript_54250:903-1559(+)